MCEVLSLAPVSYSAWTKPSWFKFPLARPQVSAAETGLESEKHGMNLRYQNSEFQLSNCVDCRSKSRTTEQRRTECVTAEPRCCSTVKASRSRPMTSNSLAICRAASYGQSAREIHQMNNRSECQQQQRAAASIGWQTLRASLGLVRSKRFLFNANISQ